MYWDSTYLIFVLPALLITMLAQANVSGAFSKYSRRYNRRGYTGYEIARRILDDHGLYHVRIEQVRGSLTDHFDPTKDVVRLSETVYHSSSVAAIGVAAHEVGHAIQYAEGYLPIRVRAAIVPVTNIGSALSWPIFFLGLIMSFEPLLTLGIWMFLIVVIFQLITLPVEFNASGRALATIRNEGILEGEEYTGAKRMLRAAALTYVAALLSSILQLFRLLALADRRKR